MKISAIFATVLVVVLFIAVGGYLIGYNDGVGGQEPAIARSAVAAPTSPTGIVDDRDVYYPGTEALAPDEMRIVALGTGMPNARPKQAAPGPCLRPLVRCEPVDQQGHA